MPRTGTSKDLFESYLLEWLWLWRQHYGDDPFAKTLSSISPTYMRKYCSSIVPQYALFEMWSPLHGGKKQNTQYQYMGLNWRKEIKRKKRQKTHEGKQQFHFASVFIYKIRKIAADPINSLYLDASSLQCLGLKHYFLSIFEQAHRSKWLLF